MIKLIVRTVGRLVACSMYDTLLRSTSIRVCTS